MKKERKLSLKTASFLKRHEINKPLFYTKGKRDKYILLNSKGAESTDDLNPYYNTVKRIRLRLPKDKIAKPIEGNVQSIFKKERAKESMIFRFFMVHLPLMFSLFSHLNYMWFLLLSELFSGLYERYTTYAVNLYKIKYQIEQDSSFVPYFRWSIVIFWFFFCDF